MNMTIEAQRTWDAISDTTKAEILSSAWCTQCVAMMGMTVETGNTGKFGLVLRGKCVKCAGAVCRIVGKG